MECRNLEITLVSAENLPNLRTLGRMKVYGEVSLNGEAETAMKTTADVEGETTPRWNSPFEYKVKESSLRQPGLQVVVKLYCQRTLGDKPIGEVKIPVNSLFESGIRAEDPLTYAVAGTPEGRLYILYSFGDVFMEARPSSVWRKAMWNAAASALGGIWVFVFGLMVYARRRKAALQNKRVF